MCVCLCVCVFVCVGVGGACIYVCVRDTLLRYTCIHNQRPLLLLVAFTYFPSAQSIEHETLTSRVLGFEPCLAQFLSVSLSCCFLFRENQEFHLQGCC